MLTDKNTETKQVSHPTSLLLPPTGGGEISAAKTVTRTRKKLALETYEHGKSVSLTQQRIDKVTVTFNLKLLTVNQNSGGDANDVGLMDYIMRICQLHTDVFTWKHGSKRITIPEKKGWLFSGNIEFREAGRHNGYDISTVVITLNLNLTRFIHHKQHYSFKALCALLPEEALSKSVNIKTVSLDGKDNYLSEKLHLKSWDTEKWMRLYIDKVTQLLEKKLLPPGQESIVTGYISYNNTVRGNLLCGSWSSWYVSYCECYVEFKQSNAIGLVKEIEEVANLFSPSVNGTNYPVSSSGTTHNSRAVAIDVQHSQIELEVYAKMFNRLRAEMRYKGKIRDIFGGKARAKHIGDRLEDLPRFLMVIMGDANTRLNKAFQELGGVLADDNSSTPATLFELLQIIQDEAGNPVLAQEIFVILQNRQCLTSSREELKKIAARLVRKKSLKLLE